jgi:hypothetical protein
MKRFDRFLRRREAANRTLVGRAKWGFRNTQSTRLRQLALLLMLSLIGPTMTGTAGITWSSSIKNLAPVTLNMHEAASKAFVQIKSTVGKPLSCTVKLSNALKSAQSKLPWFVMLYVAGRTPRKPAIYVKHIWQPELEKILREVRLAEKVGVLLNKKKLRITFDKSDRKSEDELVSWMEECIDVVRPDYSQRKAELYHTVGFEGGYAVGQFNLVADDEDTLFANFLGLGDGLQATKFSLTPTRFGIEDNEPTFSFEKGTVHIRQVRREIVRSDYGAPLANI